MGPTDADVEHINELARLKLSAGEAQALKQDLQHIFEFFEELSALPTEGVEPLVRPFASSNVFRDDVIRQGLDHESVLAIANETQGGFVKVPRTAQDVE